MLSCLFVICVFKHVVTKDKSDWLYYGESDHWSASFLLPAHFILLFMEDFHLLNGSNQSITWIESGCIKIQLSWISSSNISLIRWHGWHGLLCHYYSKETIMGREEFGWDISLVTGEHFHGRIFYNLLKDVIIQ